MPAEEIGARFERGIAVKRLLDWARLVFTLPAHRTVRLAPGVYLHIARGTTDRQIKAALRAALTEREIRKWLLS